jgi:hypothetical protein
LYARHNRLRDALAEECRLAGLTAITECSPPSSSERPADVLISFSDVSNPTAADTAVGHPLLLSSSLAAVAPGDMAEQMEKSKRAENGAVCAAAGWKCAPVCVETTGAWGAEGQKLVRRLIKLQSMRLGRPVAEVAAKVWKRLHAAVTKGTALMLTRAYPGVLQPNSPMEQLLGARGGQAAPP